MFVQNSPSLRTHRFLHTILLVGLALGVAGCPPSPLLNKQQLGGIEPIHDLASLPQLANLKTQPVSKFSVHGVRLLDPIKRAVSLWGKPQRKETNRYIWTNNKGTYTLQVRLGRRVMQAGKPPVIVIRQIDIFSSFASRLHPTNRALLSPKQIRSSNWRSQTFGSLGKKEQTHLREYFLFSKKGYRFLLFSRLLPLHKKMRAMFSLVAPETLLNKESIVPIS